MRLSVVLLMAAVIGGCAADRESDGPDLRIRLLAAEGRCEVREVELPCSEVPVYLRDTLKVPLETFIAVDLPRGVKRTADLQSLVSVLMQAGFTTTIGSIEIG
jgi:hypothetical protein